MPNDADANSDDSDDAGDDSMPWLPRALAVVFVVGFLAGGGLMLMVNIQSLQSLRKGSLELRQANWLLEKDRGKVNKPAEEASE